jgi:hypothetical protein
VTYFEAPRGSHFGVLENLGSSSNPLTAKIIDFIHKNL